MSSYQIAIQDDVLRVGFNRQIRVSGDQIVKDALVELDKLIDRQEILGGRLLKIYGPQSIAVAYALSHRLTALYGTIAIYDPKIGRPGYRCYIVTTSSNPAYTPGDLIETNEPNRERQQIKVVLCGPPQSGKSCLREGLKWQIMGLLDAPYPYVITACPDGECAGMQEVFQRDAQSAQDIKATYKGDITPQYAEKMRQAVTSSNNLITIVDVGGRMSPENELIFQAATYAVILAGDEGQNHQLHWADWQDFCQRQGLQIIARIHSDLDAVEDRIDTESPVLQGMVHSLRRGKDVSDRPMIKALASQIVSLTQPLTV
jgi:CRISPR-associated protein Csx3